MRDHRRGGPRIQGGGDHAAPVRQEQKFAAAGSPLSASAPPRRPRDSRPPARRAAPGPAVESTYTGVTAMWYSSPFCRKKPLDCSGKCGAAASTTPRFFCAKARSRRPATPSPCPRGSVTRKMAFSVEILRPQIRPAISWMVARSPVLKADAHVRHGAEQRAHRPQQLGARIPQRGVRLEAGAAPPAPGCPTRCGRCCPARSRR